MKANLKTATLLLLVTVGSVVWTLSQPTGPIFPVTDNSLAGWIKDTNGYPIVHAVGVTVDTSSLTNLSVNTATNLTSVTNIINPVRVWDGTNLALVSSSGAIRTEQGALSYLTDSVLIYGNVGITNSAQGTNASTAVYVTNSGPIAVFSGTNQVSWCLAGTNIGYNTTGLGTADYLAWVSTNTVFTTAGGSGVLNDITISTSTNKDVNVFVFTKRPTATLTVGSALSIGPVDMQYCVGAFATTNTALGGTWAKCGTNYVINLSFAKAVQNKESSTELYLLATHLGTMSNFVANETYTRVGVINDK